MLQVKIKVEQEMMTERLIKPLFKAAFRCLNEAPLFFKKTFLGVQFLLVYAYTLTADPDSKNL